MEIWEEFDCFHPTSIFHTPTWLSRWAMWCYRVVVELLSMPQKNFRAFLLGENPDVQKVGIHRAKCAAAKAPQGSPQVAPPLGSLRPTVSFVSKLCIAVFTVFWWNLGRFLIWFNDYSTRTENDVNLDSWYVLFEHFVFIPAPGGLEALNQAFRQVWILRNVSMDSTPGSVKCGAARNYIIYRCFGRKGCFTATLLLPLHDCHIL